MTPRYIAIALLLSAGALSALLAGVLGVIATGAALAGDCNHCRDIRAKLARQKVALKERDACAQRQRRRIRALEAERDRIREARERALADLAEALAWEMVELRVEPGP